MFDATSVRRGQLKSKFQDELPFTSAYSRHTCAIKNEAFDKELSEVSLSEKKYLSWGK